MGINSHVSTYECLGSIEERLDIQKCCYIRGHFNFNESHVESAEYNAPSYRQRVSGTAGQVGWTNKQFLCGEAIAVGLVQ
jgi:hypothetical protein